MRGDLLARRATSSDIRNSIDTFCVTSDTSPSNSLAKIAGAASGVGGVVRIPAAGVGHRGEQVLVEVLAEPDRRRARCSNGGLFRTLLAAGV